MGSCCFKAPGGNSTNKVHVGKNQVQPITDQPSAHSHHDDWDYKNCEGWCKRFPDAKKSSQSPVDILSSSAVFDEQLEKSPIQLKYESNSFTDITNNGHTYVVSGPSENNLVSGCCLSNPYRLAQFHMHWGSSDLCGSEHLIDGKAFSAELHFVHWNFVKYPSFKDAAASNEHDGLLVLGVLIKIGNENEELEKIIVTLNEIKLRGKSAKISNNFDMRKLFPSDLAKYWSYPGSLTTPPCTQSVKWVVFVNPIEISAKQINHFRSLHTCGDSSECGDANKLVNNFRPVCKLNKRKIHKSFK